MCNVHADVVSAHPGGSSHIQIEENTHSIVESIEISSHFS